jgi:hypothetical protein
MTANTEPEFNMTEELRLYAETLGKIRKPASRQLLIDAAERIEELEKQLVLVSNTLAVAASTPLTLPFNDDTRLILGRPCFACCGLARRLREKGHQIEQKAEAEQAAVLHWMLNLYLKHGANWAEVGDKELHGQDENGEIVE